MDGKTSPVEANRKRQSGKI